MAGAEDLVFDERTSVFARSIRALPDGMLDALARGLEAHREDLVTGRLFKSRKRGGCLVGVMLRELDPARFESGRVRFWLLDRWRHRAASYRGVVGHNPRLRHIEWTFDAAVRQVRALSPRISRAQACVAVADSFRRSVDAEKTWRSARLAASAMDSPAASRRRSQAPVGA
jgi:hypothetical protein